MLTIYDVLKGNDIRSIGKSKEVVQLVTCDTELFKEVKIVLDEIQKQMVNGAPAIKVIGRMLIKTLSENEQYCYDKIYCIT
jgi:hypothetical protein